MSDLSEQDKRTVKRTPEQRAADDALTSAIQAVNAAYFSGPDDKPLGLITDYLVVFAEQRFDDDGDDDTSVCLMAREGTMPGYRMAGLLAAAQDRLKYACDDE